MEDLPVPVWTNGVQPHLPGHLAHSTPEGIHCWIGERDPHQFQDPTNDKRIHPTARKHPDRCAFCGTARGNPRHHGQRDNALEGIEI